MDSDILKEKENILNKLEILIKLCGGDPYEILQVKIGSSNNEISEKYNQLLKENQDDNEFKEKLDYSYKLLSNQSVRDVLDSYSSLRKFKNDNNYNKKSKENQLNILYLISLVISWPVVKVSSIVNSNKTIIKSSEVVMQIYQKRGISGFYNGSTLIYMVSIGVIDTVMDNAIYSIINPTKLPYPLFRILSKVIPAIFKHPQSLVLDLLNISPISFTIIDIIKKVILRSDGNQLQWKNMFFGFSTGVSMWISRSFIDYLINEAIKYSKNSLFKNPNCKLFKFLNYLIDNIYLRSSIVALLYLPIDIIRIQNPRLLMEGYLDKSMAISMNPITIIIELFKSSGMKRFINGYISQYLVVLVEEIAATYDLHMVNLNQESLRNEDI